MDTSNSKGIQFTEFAQKMIFLCKGTKIQKTLASFKIYDIDNSKGLNLDELTDYLTGVLCLKLKKVAKGGSMDDYNNERAGYEKQAKALAIKCFEHFDKDTRDPVEGEDDEVVIILKEFVTYFLESGMMD